MHFRYQCAIMLSDRYVAVLRERRETNGYKYIIESGTNELEVLEFTFGKQSLRNHCCKDREILTYQPVTPVPNSHPSIEGIFMPRDTMISVVNLKRCLGMPDDAKTEGLFIITNFNKLNIAFHVDAVLGIHRVSWEAIISRMPRSIPSRTAPRPVSSRWMTS